MWQVWMDDRLYGVWDNITKVETILDLLSYKYPDAKLEVRMPS